MKRKLDRVVIDTNLWISFLIKNDFKSLDFYIRNGVIRVVFSIELLEELIEVVNRPKFKKYFEKKDVQRLLELFEMYGEIVEVSSNVNDCRDSKDNFLLSLSIDSQADILITGDSDLLILNEIGNTRILTIAQYLELLIH